MIKICIIEVYLLKYYFESHLIYKWRYYRQTIFNQLNIMVPYVDIIGLCHSVAILWEIYVMRPKCHVRWLRFHFKRMLITGLGQLTLPNVKGITEFSFFDDLKDFKFYIKNYKTLLFFLLNVYEMDQANFAVWCKGSLTRTEILDEISHFLSSVCFQ